MPEFCATCQQSKAATASAESNNKSKIIIHFRIVWPCIATDSLWIKPTDALNSNFIGITTLHVSGSLSAHHQEFLAVHRLWYTLCSCDEPFATKSRMELLQFHPAPCSKRSQLHKMYQSRCTAKKSWWWAERLSETCRVVIPIKLEFSSSVGFIHKDDDDDDDDNNNNNHNINENNFFVIRSYS